jgi:predicted O-methyltransferase YrrM
VITITDQNINLNIPNPVKVDEHGVKHGISVDACHGLTIFGAAVSAKPESLLELGVGGAFVTNLLLDAIEFNEKGSLTCVDSLHDDFPPNLFDGIKERGANVIAPIEEKDFVFSVKENTYDFLMSDADHNHAGEWTDQIFKIMKPDSIMFFHDVTNPGYPNLLNYQKRAEELGKPFYLFNSDSRSDERCWRGLLMIVNKK